MLSYIKLALALISLVQYFVKKAQDQGLINQGRAQIVLENLEKSNAELRIADKARKDVRDGIAADPTSVRKPDPFERQD